MAGKSYDTKKYFEKCAALRDWRLTHAGGLPNRRSDKDAEKSLASWLSKALQRRQRALSDRPSQRQLTPNDATHLDSIVGMAIGEASAQHSAASEMGASSGGPHPAAPSDRVDEVESSSSGGPHSAASCKLPPSVFVAASGKRNAADSIKLPRAQSMKRPRQMDPSSGDLHPAAESVPQPGRTDPCDGAHLAGEAGHTKCVAQPAVSDCLVVVRAVKTPWCDDVAAGLKFFECVGNQKTRRVNPFNSLKVGDLCVVVRSKDNKKVTAVAEVQGPQRLEQTDRSLLVQHLQPGRHDEIQNFLGDAPSFNVVFFQQSLRLQSFGSHLAFTCSENTRLTGALSTRWRSSLKHIRRFTAAKKRITRCRGTLFDNI